MKIEEKRRVHGLGQTSYLAELAHLDVAFQPSSSPAQEEKPLVIFIHGHACTKNSWLNPLQETLGNSPQDFVMCIRFTTADVKNIEDIKESLPPGTFLFSLIQRPESSRELCSFWDFVQNLGYPTLTWSQKAANERIQLAVEELEMICKVVLERLGYRRIIFICHSRGGLVARYFLQRNPHLASKILGVVMLSTPNQGSKLAIFAEKFSRFRYLSQFVLFGRRIFPQIARSHQSLEALLGYLKRSVRFLQSEAIQELKPYSSFLEQLKEKEGLEKRLGVPYFHLAGNRSQYDRIYYLPQGENYLVKIPILYDKLPSFLLPWELIDGKGDGLVAVCRARLGFERVFEEFRVNHSEILMDPLVQKRVKEILTQVVDA